jgi:phosphoglycerate dehydrogenase-like enzyme
VVDIRTGTMSAMTQQQPDRVGVVVLDDYQDVALSVADWSPLQGRAEVTVLHEHLGGEDAVVERLADVRVVVAMRERTPFPRSVLERLPNLRLLVTTGMRNAAIDLDAARDVGVTVCGTGGGAFEAAEHTWALLMAAARRLDVEIQNIRDGGWMTTLGTSLQGRTLGLVGLGRLGGRVAEYGRAFGMDVVAWSRNLTDDRCAEVGARRAGSLEHLLAESDFVSLHLVLGDRSRGLIGRRELGLMKPTAWLVNTSRGPLCDEAALLQAVRGGTIAGAALDVFAQEPLPADHPLRTEPNVIATPHVGYVTEQAYGQRYTEAVEDVVGFLDGSPLRVLT